MVVSILLITMDTPKPLIRLAYIGGVHRVYGVCVKNTRAGARAYMYCVFRVATVDTPCKRLIINKKSVSMLTFHHRHHHGHGGHHHSEPRHISIAILRKILPYALVS